MSSATDDEATISIPSIAFVAVLGFIIYRYFWSSSPSSSSSRNSSSSSTSSQRDRFTAAQVDQVSSMFPQLNRRDIMWDLQRNRGNVQATTERIITTGRLESAPQSFVPSIPISPANTTNTNVSSASSTIPKTTPIEPDLITRYNLKAKVDTKGKEKEEPNYGWSSSKNERQAMLQRRRDEMILAARRKMQERDSQQHTDGSGTGVGQEGGAVVAGNATTDTIS